MSVPDLAGLLVGRSSSSSLSSELEALSDDKGSKVYEYGSAGFCPRPLVAVRFMARRRELERAGAFGRMLVASPSAGAVLVRFGVGIVKSGSSAG